MASFFRLQISIRKFVTLRVRLAEIQKLTRHFYFTFPGNIWKIKPDFFSQILILEIRQPEILQAAFYSLSTETGSLLLENFQDKERWWTGVEAAQNGSFFLHGYQVAKDTGQHLGIKAISETNGQLSWEKPTLTFFGLLTEKTLLAQNVMGQLIEIDILTGSEQKYSASPEHAKTQIQALELSRSQNLQVPLPYLPSDAYYPLLQNFIRKQTGREAQQTMEYLETETHIFLSFYEEKNTVLANFLLVCSAQGEVLLDICLEPNVVGLGSDTFFIFADKLFFIQEKTSLACFLL